MPKCKSCGKRRAYLSTKKLCLKCFSKKRDLAIMQMANKKGEAWEKWKISMFKYFKKLKAERK